MSSLHHARASQQISLRSWGKTAEALTVAVNSSPSELEPMMDRHERNRSLTVALTIGLAACGGNSGPTADQVEAAVQANLLTPAKVTRCDHVRDISSSDIVPTPGFDSVWYCVADNGHFCTAVKKYGDAVVADANGLPADMLTKPPCKV